MLYMHPVKAQSDIKLALEKYGIRVISLDHEDEITKLTRVVRALDIDPGAISVFVRIQTQGLGGLRTVEEIRRRAGLCGRTGRAAEPAPATRSACASMSAARSRIPTPMSGRWPRPTGCATG